MVNSQYAIRNTQWWKKLFFSKLLWTIFFGLSTFLSFSTTPVCIKTIQKQTTALYINTTDDIFLLYKGMIERYNPDGSFFQNYGSIYINEHTEIISVNGFKTILFSPDYGKIIQLDNRLRELYIFDAYDLGNYIITCVGTSYDNNFLWIWDAASQRLIKIDKDRNPVFVSNTLSLILGMKINPRQIVESGVMLYVVDSKNGIFVFDNQGNYIKQMPIENVKNLKVIDNQLYYTKDNVIYRYDNLTFTETKYTQTPNLKDIQIGKTIICGSNADGWVEIWKF